MDNFHFIAQKIRMKTGPVLAIGIAIGVAVGASMKNYAVGFAVGIAIVIVLFGVGRFRR